MSANTVVLIPAYQPDHHLLPYVRELVQSNIHQVVVVDDGGGSEFDSVFGEVSAIPGTHVIRYLPNGGKGHALKTGLEYIRDHIPEADIILTADADGQHKVKDIKRMIKAQTKNPDALLLGSRDFSLPQVPFKSRNGNRITSAVFHVLYGAKVSDTQTGLRAFSRKLLPMMIEVKGERYEYEMKVLIECAERKIPMVPLIIDTVYENNNEGSHFHAVRDSARIYWVLLSNFLKFVTGSLLSFCVDYLLFILFNALLEKHFPSLNEEFFFILKFVKRILISTVAARLLSGLFNYFYNAKVSFATKEARKGASFAKYLCVFFGCMILSAGLVSGIHLLTGAPEEILKIFVDLLIFILNYNLQSHWVFAKKEKAPKRG